MIKAEIRVGEEIWVRDGGLGQGRNISVERRGKKWSLNRASSLKIKCSSMDRGIYQDLSSTKSRQKWIYRGAIENLSRAKSSQLIKNLLRSYRLDRELKNLAWWIIEVVEYLSGINWEISMDRESVKIYWENRNKGSIEGESIEDLSKSCRTWRKGVFQGGKNTKRWMQQAS